MRRPGQVQPMAALVLAFLVVLGVSGAAGAASPDLLVVPDLVEIGSFFQGHAIKVSGKIPPGTEAVLEVVGKTAPEKMMRKGRRGGLWMNVGELEISGAPSLYLVMSTKPEMLTTPEPEAPWGYPALKKRLSFSGQVRAGEVPEFQRQFFELKESEQLYAVFPGALRATDAGGGRTIRGTFRVPANLKAGAYEVCLSVVQNGQVMERKCAEIAVQLTGFPALLSTLAYEHSAFYGIMAVIIAIVTGFLMGYLFRGGGGH